MGQCCSLSCRNPADRRANHRFSAENHLSPPQANALAVRQGAALDPPPLRHAHRTFMLTPPSSAKSRTDDSSPRAQRYSRKIRRPGQVAGRRSRIEGADPKAAKRAPDSLRRPMAVRLPLAIPRSWGTRVSKPDPALSRKFRYALASSPQAPHEPSRSQAGHSAGSPRLLLRDQQAGTGV